MKRVLLVICAALVVFAGILLVIPSFVDWSKYRSQIVSQLGDATGHHYTIDGDLSLALVPYPHVVVEGLSVASAEGVAPLASIERVDVSVAMMPLFKGKVDVTSIALVKPDIKLSIKSDGTPSWMTATLQEKMAHKVDAESSGQMAESVALNDIRIKDGAFSFSDARTDKSYVLKDIDLNIHGDTLRGPFNADGSFEYNGEFVKVDFNSGKIGSDADSMAVQADIKIPSSSTSVQWSGVVAIKGAPEIQGEIDVATGNVGALMALAGAQAPAGFDKKFSLRGILTASQQEAALRNMKIGYADVSGTGSVSVEDLAEDKTMTLAADLALDGPVDVLSFMPSAPVGKKKKKEKRLMPETVTLPRAMTVKVVLSGPGASFGALSVSDLQVKVDFKGRTLSYEASGKMPGGARGNESGTLTFASMSQSAQTGAVTLSDPVLAYKFDFKAEKIEESLKAFVVNSPVKGKLSAKGAGKVTPQSISMDKGLVHLGLVPVNVTGSYALGARDKVTVSVAARQMDLDKYMPPADSSKKSSVEDSFAKLALPFDLDLSWALDQAQLKERQYDRLAGHANLTGKQLKLSDVELKDAGGSSAKIAGKVDDITALKGIDVSIQAVSPDVPALISEITKKPSSLPQGVKGGEVIAVFKGHAEKLSFTANLKAVNGTMDVNGALANVLKVPTVSDLTLRLKHPNYVELARLFAPDFKSGVAIKKTLDVFASVKQDAGVYTLSELQADIGPARITGAVTADMTGAKPSLFANIQAGDLPLDSLLGHSVRHKGTVRAQPVRRKNSSKWPTKPLNNEWMHKFNLKLNGTAQSFSYGPWVLDNAAIDVSLQDGALDVTSIDGAMYGGQVVLSGNATSPALTSPLAVDGTVKLENVSLESFVQSFSGSKLIRAKGNISTDVAFTTAGANPAALIGGLNGKGGAQGSDFVFEGFDLARLSRTLAQPPGSIKDGFASILDTSMSGGSTKFDLLSSAFTMTKGVINFQELALTGPDASVNSLGYVNLPLWTIDMESTIQLVEPQDAPPLKAVFKGPLDRPGQTFAKSAMDSYVRKLIGTQVQDAIIKELDKDGALQGILGGLTGQPAPTPKPTEPVQQQVAPEQQNTPAPRQQRDITPEDVFRGVLQGVLGGQ